MLFILSLRVKVEFTAMLRMLSNAKQGLGWLKYPNTQKFLRRDVNRLKLFPRAVAMASS